ATPVDSCVAMGLSMRAARPRIEAPAAESRRSRRPRRYSACGCGTAWTRREIRPAASALAVDLHDDSLGLGEELAREVAALAADARVTDATERRAQVADEEAVHPDGAGAQLRGDAVGAGEVLGEEHG